MQLVIEHVVKSFFSSLVWIKCCPATATSLLLQKFGYFKRSRRKCLWPHQTCSLFEMEVRPRSWQPGGFGSLLPSRSRGCCVNTVSERVQKGFCVIRCFNQLKKVFLFFFLVAHATERSQNLVSLHGLISSGFHFPESQKHLTYGRANSLIPSQLWEHRNRLRSLC